MKEMTLWNPDITMYNGLNNAAQSLAQKAI
uniref:Serine threonine-protein kinase paka-like protein n=1 Tax=Triatoma infestans TaxID=30076 RepID=A0A170YI23_TRIIF